MEGVALQFGGKVVIRDFQLRLQPGERVRLAGPSGSGKSSVLRLLVGLEKPDAGCIRIGGELLTDVSVWKLRQRLAYVSQEAPLGEGRVRQALQDVFAWKANSEVSWEEGQIAARFEAFRLAPSLLDQEVEQLSGGERQRIALVLALALKRDILLLDEVTSALDAELKQIVIQHLGQQAKTMLVVSHDAPWDQLNLRTVTLSTLTP